MSLTIRIPRSDANFNHWQGNLIEMIDANRTVWKIEGEQFLNLLQKQACWMKAYIKFSNKYDCTLADIETKILCRANYESALREFVTVWLENNSNIHIDDFARMGLKMKSNVLNNKQSVISPRRHIIDFQKFSMPDIYFKPAHFLFTLHPQGGFSDQKFSLKVTSDLISYNTELYYPNLCLISTNKNKKSEHPVALKVVAG